MFHSNIIILKPYIQLMRLDKPVGIFLLLWPTLWALWIAGNGLPSLKVLGIFILGVVVMRSAGCVINDYADRHVDGYVTRTKERPLACGKLKAYQAILLFIVLCFIGLLLITGLNILTIELSFIAVAIMMLYPFAKRFTYFPQVILGCAFSWGIPMAFAAQCNSVPPIAWLLYVVASLWPIAYDSMYAMVDRKDDEKIGIKSTVLFFGNGSVGFIMTIQALVLLGLFVLGHELGFKKVYYFSLVVAFLLMIYQFSLLKSKDPQKYFAAFTNNQWVGLTIFIGIYLNYRF